MSNSHFDFASAAAVIIAPLEEAVAIMGQRKEASAAFTGRVNAKTLTGYAACAVAIADLMARDMWTTGKQKKGVKSGSVMLKAAIEAEASARKVNAARAKRLVEKAAAILVGKKAISGVMPEAENGGEEGTLGVVNVLNSFKIETEAQLLRHVDGAPVKDPVADILKAMAKLSPDQMKSLRDKMNEQA